MAAKLLNNLSFVPVVLVGRKPMNNRALIALDGSENAQRAVAFIGDVLSGHDFQFRRVHVILARSGEKPKYRQLFAAKSFAQERKMESKKIFADAERQLIRSGFESKQIRTKMVVSVPSRAAAIASEAVENNCAMIVLGRRGLSKPK